MEKIYYTIPFDTNKNIGKYYNDFFNIIPDDNDWVCIVDGDTIFTTSDYGNLISEVIKNNPEASCFTAYTNRVGCEWQIAPGVDVMSDDIKYHRNYGEKIKILYGSSVIDVTDKPRNQVLSGFFILLKKSVWRKIGGFKEDGMLGIDSDLHWRLQDNKEKLYLIKGLYLYHWYRGGDKSKKDHLL